jgi:hypothetical protein
MSGAHRKRRTPLWVWAYVLLILGCATVCGLFITAWQAIKPAPPALSPTQPGRGGGSTPITGAGAPAAPHGGTP